MKQYSEEEFLDQVLRISSVNGMDDEGKLAWFLADYLKDRGVNAVVQEIDKKHANVVAVLEGKT
ncbi:MAG TPA: M20 family peptidase, partial [Candidatus Dorea gallistercoris]|nr:M20 family peptidase [Candidatus Dorea gallistercoris]